MRHEAWSDGSFFPVMNRSAAAQVEAGATLLWSVDAASWHEAMTLYHNWKGWKPYVPLDDDPVIYTAKQEYEALVTQRVIGEAQRSALGEDIYRDQLQSDPPNISEPAR